MPSITDLQGSAYDRIQNYTLKIVNGSLTITKAVSSVTVAATSANVLPTGISTAPITITVAQSLTGLYGTPTGTVTVSDTFTPITATGTGTAITGIPFNLTLVNGTASFAISDPTLGIHSYAIGYNGDKDFQAATALSSTSVRVDNPDFTVVSTTTPIQIAPGVTPGGNPTVDPNEQAATPETATVQIAPLLGYTTSVTLTCSSPSSYVTCTLTPSAITLDGKTTQTSTLAVYVPATLPANFTSQLRQSAGRIALAALPFALLTMLPLALGRRRKLRSLLLVLILSISFAIGTTGCGGGNLVKVFTPVPAGLQQVTVTGTSGSYTRTFVVPINIQ